MRTKNYFALAVAAMALAFSGCSDDKDITSELGPDGQPLGDLIEGISINFGASTGPSSRAYGEDKNGIGTENSIYEAFVFAHEANPLHPRAKDGDWTVIRVTKTPILDNTGRNVDPTEKDKQEPLVNDGESTDWLVKNVATFKGVRQGENVYVIANHPTLTLQQAEDLCRQAEKSEATIKAYVSALNKDYVGKLTYQPETENTEGTEEEKKKMQLPKGQFIMAGMNTIPVSPTIPSNGVFTVKVGLDRELAKVDFRTKVTSSEAQLAYQKIEFHPGDGIMVARIARNISPFSEQKTDFYVPILNCVEDWPETDHAFNDITKKYNLFCDNTIEGSTLFDGTLATVNTKWFSPVAPATAPTIRAFFNTTAPAGTANEFRYSWVTKSPADADKDNPTEIAKALADKTNPIWGDKLSLNAPIFYTTPNYGGNTNGVSVIAIQATYVGPDVYKAVSFTGGEADKQAILKKYFAKAIEKAKDATFMAQPAIVENAVTGAATTAAITITNPLATVGGDETKLAALVKDTKDMIEKGQFEAFYKLNAADGSMAGGYTDKNFDALYQAALMLYILDNGVALKAGDKIGEDAALIEADLKKYPGYKTYPSATYPGAETLLLGAAKFTASNQTEASAISTAAAAAALSKARYEDLTTQANFDYHAGMKLYYRVDIANYTDDKSNKITERNMYYSTVGTINSLGAKTIHEAIYSEQNTMHIDVTVNKWKYSSQEVGI